MIASDLGPGAACSFDYCNCGGINVPLLPSTNSGSATVACDYTTQPTAENCPTAPPVLPGGGGGSGGGGTGQPSVTAPPGGSGGGGGSGSGGTGQPSVTPPPGSGGGGEQPSVTPPAGGGGGGNPPPLPAPVTTGGPISTASDAFATSAPSVTTLSYSGGALTYTKATFTSLASLTSLTSITATVTKTASAGEAVQTYVGPVVVGPGGIFWGPPGTAPDCVWPFCSSSGPAPPPGGDTDGGTGGGVGGSFGCQDCNGGGGQNGQGGGSGGGSDGDGGEPAPPEACPGAKRIKRSDSDASSNVRIVKRVEEALNSNNPLKDALNNFGDQASAAIDSTEGIMTNKLPPKFQNGYVSGLKGHYTPTKTFSVGTGDNAQTFRSGQSIYWEVRFDFDPDKGPHVNAQFGKKPSSKFAYQLDQSKWPDGTDDLKRMQKAMVNTINELNDACNYDRGLNMGKSTPTWDTTEDDAMQKLKDYYKNAMSGPC